MHEEMNQKISRLIDNELDQAETLDLLKKMQSDEALKLQMSRYQAISQALKTDVFYQVRSDFSYKVFQEIQQEPAYFLPQLKQQQTQERHSKRTKIFAVAASTLAAAVLVGQILRHNQAENIYQTVTAMPVSGQQWSASIARPEATQQINRHPLNAQFNDYLQAHNNSVYTNGEANFQPYAKVTAFGKD